MRKVNSNKIFDMVNVVFMILLTVVFLYPLYFTVIASFSDPYEVATGNVMFVIKGFTWDSYAEVFKNEEIWNGYSNSIVYTVFGTIFNLIITLPAAYALSKKNLWMRGWISTYFIIPMYFGGGLLPTYLQVKSMGLINKPYTMIILGGLSIYNMVVTRTYFQTSVPDSLYEAAEIDGCSHFRQFFKIALPLAKPIIAVITLYYAVGRWNNYYSALIYLSKSVYYPLQMVLRNILLAGQSALSNIDLSTLDDAGRFDLMKRIYQAESMKYAIIFIASLPMLILYPFIQKHFVKGVMVGAIKG